MSWTSFFRKPAGPRGQKIHRNGLGHFANVFLRPIELAPNTNQTVYALICNGSQDEVKKQLTAFAGSPQQFIAKAPQPTSRSRTSCPTGTNTCSARMLRASTLANVVYPITPSAATSAISPPAKWLNSL